MNLVQARMARGALNRTSGQLARKAGLAHPVVVKYLAGGATDIAQVQRMKDAFEHAGILFLDAEKGVGSGVRMRDGGPTTDVVKIMDATIDEHETKRKR